LQFKTYEKVKEYAKELPVLGWFSHENLRFFKVLKELEPTIL
jgi:hypothetical protein